MNAENQCNTGDLEIAVSRTPVWRVFVPPYGTTHPPSTFGFGKGETKWSGLEVDQVRTLLLDFAIRSNIKLYRHYTNLKSDVIRTHYYFVIPVQSTWYCCNTR